MTPFLCALRADSPAPRPLEHSALAWVTIDEVAHFDLAPADWPVLHNLPAALTSA